MAHMGRPDSGSGVGLPGASAAEKGDLCAGARQRPMVDWLAETAAQVGAILV